MQFFPLLPSLVQRAMGKDGAVPAAASATPKDVGVGVDVDALLKRLEEMEARTKRLEEALEVNRRDLRVFFDAQEQMVRFVTTEQDIRRRIVAVLHALERRMDQEAPPCAQLRRRFAKPN